MKGPEGEQGVRPALLGRAHGSEGSVVCSLCEHRCEIAPGKVGVCGVRANREGKLVTLVYGLSVAEMPDPIEKKPLYHFAPGTKVLSLATPGCNFRCLFCQNWMISQMPREEGTLRGRWRLPKEVVDRAVAEGCAGVAFTYTEPTIFLEYALEVAQEARRRGLYVVWVSNGYMTPEALAMMVPLLDAANIDIKGFSEEVYRKVMGARLEPVLRNVVRLKEAGVWVEVSTLLLPGLNDGEEELRGLAAFLREHLGPETPWHVNRFHPDYRLRDRPPTSSESLSRAWAWGREEGLWYVYVDGLPGHPRESTYCIACGTPLLERLNFRLRANHLREGRCPNCGRPLEMGHHVATNRPGHAARVLCWGELRH